MRLKCKYKLNGRPARNAILIRVRPPFAPKTGVLHGPDSPRCKKLSFEVLVHIVTIASCHHAACLPFHHSPKGVSTGSRSGVRGGRRSPPNSIGRFAKPVRDDFCLVTLGHCQAGFSHSEPITPPPT